MQAGTISQANSQTNMKYGSLAVIISLILGLMAAYVWSSTLDLRGTYRSTTDLADLDDDGDLDVILAQTRWESRDSSFAGLTLWFNQGGGLFTPVSQALPGGFSAAGGDVDNDGDADLLIVDGYRITLSLNQGGSQGGDVGLFQTRNSIPLMTDWRGHTDMGGSLILGDLNNDGEVDGVIAGCCYGWTGDERSDGGGLTPSSHWVWLNNWDRRGWIGGTALNLTGLEGFPMSAATLGDLDNDGDLDIFAAVGAPTLGRSSSLAERVLINDGFGTFTDSGQRLGEAASSSVALGDLDADGDLDALVGTQNGAQLWINQGGLQSGQAGMFSASLIRISDNRIVGVFLADLDSDGDQDAFLAGSREAVIWWNDGQGDFIRSNQRFRYSGRHGLAVGDFNGDDLLDIFAGEYIRDHRVWLNQGDGTFQIATR